MARLGMLHEGAKGLDGTVRVLSAPAGPVDAVDCTSGWDLARLVDEIGRRDAEPASGPGVESHPVKWREEVHRLRRRVTPWWVVTLGLTLLAFFTSMQVGIRWRAWVAAAMVQVAAQLVGFDVVVLRAPCLVVVAAQASEGGALPHGTGVDVARLTLWALRPRSRRTGCCSCRCRKWSTR